MKIPSEVLLPCI